MLQQTTCCTVAVPRRDRLLRLTRSAYCDDDHRGEHKRGICTALWDHRCVTAAAGVPAGCVPKLSLETPLFALRVIRVDSALSAGRALGHRDPVLIADILGPQILANRGLNSGWYAAARMPRRSRRR